MNTKQSKPKIVPLKTLGAKVDLETYLSFVQYAHWKGLTKSELMREIIGEKFKEFRDQLIEIKTKSKKEFISQNKSEFVLIDAKCSDKSHKEKRKNILKYFKEEYDIIELDTDPNSKKIKKTALAFTCLVMMLFGSKN